MVLLPQTPARPQVAPGAPVDVPGVDYQVIRKVVRALRPALGVYFRPRVEGLERIPAGRALLVGVHSGGMMPADALALGAAFYRHFSFERSLQFLAHRILWSVTPGFSRFMEAIGAVKASPAAGASLLEQDRAVMVYPGGTYEVFRPWWERHQVDWNGHMGYVRLAVRTRTPIVLVPSVGAHEQFVGLTRGLALNQLVGLHKVLGRVKIMPIIWSFPFGLSIAGIAPGYVPLPAQVSVRVLEPLALHETAAGRALFRRDPRGDPAHLRRLHRTVQQHMRAALQDMSRGRIPLIGHLPFFRR